MRQALSRPELHNTGSGWTQKGETMKKTDTCAEKSMVRIW